MKHQLFLFSLIFSCSAYSMNYDMNMTKGQFIHTLTEINSYMKKNYSHSFDTKEFGWFIVGLRSMDKDMFENNKKELLSLIKPLDVLDQTE